MSSGPVEQLSPITSTSSDTSVVSTAWMSVPRSILPPFGSSETLVWIGTWRPVSLKASRTPKMAALTSRMSCAVSMISRSAPPSMQALRLLGEDLNELAEGDLAERGVVARGEVARGADRSGHEAALAGGRARDLRRLAVDLRRVLAKPPLIELEAAGLEGVRLQDLGARVQHRLVHALDHVRAIEHEGLVALALQPAVVLLGQVELLERGAHAAVEHDDPGADRLDVVARRQGS